MQKKGHQQLLRRTNDPPFLILTSLAAGPKHGYALLLDIEQFAGVLLSPGTLYGAITRLDESGLIEPMADIDRRRPYRLTASGAQVLGEVTNEMRRLSDVGAARLRLARGGLRGAST
jgi:DNA-binding PadR family transcriptional regulator